MRSRNNAVIEIVSFLFFIVNELKCKSTKFFHSYDIYFYFYKKFVMEKLNDIVEKFEITGKVTDVKAYSLRTTYDVKGVLDSASMSVHAGDTVTLGGKTCIVKSVDVSESNTGFAEGTISAEAVDSASVVAYSSGTSGSSNT